MPRSLSELFNVRMALSHRFAVPILHIIVRGEQVSLEHSICIDGACVSTLIELSMLHVLEGLVAKFWRASLVPELILVRMSQRA